MVRVMGGTMTDELAELKKRAAERLYALTMPRTDITGYGPPPTIVSKEHAEAERDLAHAIAIAESYFSTGQKAVNELAQVSETTPALHKEMLSSTELEALEVSGNFVGLIHKVIGNGPQAENDWREAASYIHALQRMIMAQAAARAYPEKFRPLGKYIVNQQFRGEA